jgi:chlorite dismutase
MAAGPGAELPDLRASGGADMSEQPQDTGTPKPLDLREKGAPRNGVPQTCDRRLFMQFVAFGDCGDSALLVGALTSTGLESVVYADAHDPRGVGVLVLAEEPAAFVTTLREAFLKPPLVLLRQKPEYAMLGRTYSSGYEPDLEDWLLRRPRRVVLDPAAAWAVWYPLRRSGAFAALSPEEQNAILREHGRIGHLFGDSGHLHDIRLACFGLDRDDNDFVIGLLGRDLHALSACVQAMRATRQTSQYMARMGPFFVGRAVWQSPVRS